MSNRSGRCRICNKEMVEAGFHIGPACAKEFKSKMFGVSDRKISYEVKVLDSSYCKIEASQDRIEALPDILNYDSNGSSDLLNYTDTDFTQKNLESAINKLASNFEFMKESGILPEEATLVGVQPNELINNIGKSFVGSIEVALFANATDKDRSLICYIYDDQNEGDSGRTTWIREYGYRQGNKIKLLNSPYYGNTFLGENMFLISCLDTEPLENYIQALILLRNDKKSEILDDDEEDYKDLYFQRYVAHAFVLKVLRNYQKYDEIFDPNNPQHEVNFGAVGQDSGLIRETLIHELIKYKKDPELGTLRFYSEIDRVNYVRSLFTNEELEKLMDFLDSI